MNTFHTCHGIERFLKTGRLQEIPKDIYAPFSMAERVQMLESILPYIHTGMYHILKGPLENLAPNLHLSFTRYNGYILFSNHKGENIYLIIEESSILSAFMDYVSNLDEDDIYTPEETAFYLHGLIKKYKKVLPPPTPIL